MTNVEKLKKIIEHEEEIEIIYAPDRRTAKYLESIAGSLAVIADDVEEKNVATWEIEEERCFIEPSTCEEMERMTGEWHHKYINQRCTNCNHVTIVDSSIFYEYCPHCGCKMVF